MCSSVRARARGGGKGGGTQFVHNRSRMTIDPRIPTMPGRSTPGFTNQADIACAKREVPWGVRRVAWRVNCILPRTARKMDFGTLCLLSCLWMAAPMSYFAFWRGHVRDSNGYYSVTASWVHYHVHTGAGGGGSRGVRNWCTQLTGVRFGRLVLLDSSGKQVLCCSLGANREEGFMQLRFVLRFVSWKAYSFSSSMGVAEDISKQWEYFWQATVLRWYMFLFFPPTLWRRVGKMGLEGAKEGGRFGWYAHAAKMDLSIENSHGVHIFSRK